MEEIDCDWSQLSIICGGLASTYSSPLKMLNFQHISSCSFAIYIQFVDLIDIWALQKPSKVRISPSLQNHRWWKIRYFFKCRTCCCRYLFKNLRFNGSEMSKRLQENRKQMRVYCGNVSTVKTWKKKKGEEKTKLCLWKFKYFFS